MLDGLENEIDIKSLRLLSVLLSECSVSRTAEIVGRAQPSVSSALKRLRRTFSDPLLVRSGQHLVPTERGMELRAQLGRLLHDLDAMMTDGEAFDPALSLRPVRLMASNCLADLLLPALVSRIRAEAPHTAIEFVSAGDQRQLVAAMERGEVDGVVGNWPEPPGALRRMPILETDFACLVSPRHALARQRGAIGLKDYLEADHLSPSPALEAGMSPIDGRLAQLGLVRRISLHLSGFGAVPPILEAEPGLVFTTARPLAVAAARDRQLRIVQPPSELGRMQLYLLWHDRAHRNARNRWLRRLIVEEARKRGEVLHKDVSVSSFLPA